MLSPKAEDPDGGADAAVLEALEGYTLLHIDQNRWIELTTDGEQMWESVEKRN